MNIRTDDLGIKGLKLMQNPKLFCFGTDSVLLANFVKLKKDAYVLDMGTGNGIIPVLLSAKTYAKKIYALEIQEPSYLLAKENVKLNNLEDLIEVVLGDLKDTSLFKGNFFDAITVNPPYKPIGTGVLNPKDHLTIARHEVLCNLEDIAKSASRLLKPMGKIFMVHKPERLSEIICTLKKYNIETKRLQMVAPKTNDAPCMVLVEGVKGGKPFLKFEKPLIIYNDEGVYTANINNLYNKTKD